MTDETFVALITHVRKHYIPPSELLPSGMGISVIPTEDVLVDEPRMEGGFVYIHPDDYQELFERIPDERQHL